MPVTIIVDSRETNSTIPKILKTYPDVVIDIQQLECGDYMVHDECVIERKEALDFVNSIRDGRLFGQVKLMKANYTRPVLIVEGDLYAKPHGFTPASIQGALSDLVILEGISVIPSKSIHDTAGLIATMARHSQEGLGYEINTRVAKPKDIGMLQQYIIEGLPGCGAKRAQGIIKHFGSVFGAMTASQADWEKVPGLGKATAQKVYEIIHAGS